MKVNAEIKRRTNGVGTFTNDASITRLVGAMMLERNDEYPADLSLSGLRTYTTRRNITLTMNRG